MALTEGVGAGGGAGPAPMLARAARRVMVQVVLPLALAAALLLVDRGAVAVQARAIEAGLGTDAFTVGLTTPILFLGVLLFEVPSALLADRVGLQRWLTGSLVVWAGASLCTALATGPGTFLLARGVASVAQAGFLPVALMLVCNWAPGGFRTRLLAPMVLAGLLAAVIALPVSQAVLRLEGAGGWAGWRWLFAFIGVCCLPLAGLVWRRIPDQPGAAGWLPAPEREAMAWARSVERRERQAGSRWSALLDQRLLLLAGIGFALSLSTFASSVWYGVLVRDVGAPVGALEVAFVAAIVLTTVMWSRRVDRGGRLLHALVVALGLASVAYAAGVLRGPMVTKLVGLVAHAATVAAARTMIWSAASRLATLGRGGAASLAVIDATGLVASFIAPRVVANLAQTAGSLQAGLLALVLVLLAATGLAAIVRVLSDGD